ncbi:phosphoglycerate mutase [Panaeolus papilionaceus]|nr:phosphoglycerate mutase [Panaeolus papilionaceus]
MGEFTYDIAPHFGLKNTSPTRWSEFREAIKTLNKEAKKDGGYVKFFLLSRHGQGYHNVAESKYGTEAWDDYWSKLNGDGEIVWGPDPQLTPLGISQAEDIQRVMLQESKEGLEKPQKRYCSPLTRAMHTCRTMYGGVFPNASAVMVLENCREENGVHTCDKRNTRSYIASAFPSFEIEAGLTEQDELWDADVRETKAQVAERAGRVLDWVFENDRNETFISITAHGGWINGFLTAVGRKTIPLPTGGVLPVVVKGKWLA